MEDVKLTEDVVMENADVLEEQEESQDDSSNDTQDDSVPVQDDSVVVQDVGTVENQLSSVHDQFEDKAKVAAVVTQPIGELDHIKSVETLNKSAYYAVFASKDHENDSVGEAIRSVHMARFESKAELKKVINSLDDNGFKLIDILKGRPLAFEIKVRKVSDIKIGG